MKKEQRTLYIIDEDGNEIEMFGLFTFYDPEFQKDYVLYVNPSEEDGDVYASAYDEEGHLYPIETEAEWAIVESEFEKYLNLELSDEEEIDFQA